MADHFKSIYANEAAAYDLLVSYEDYQGNLPRVLNEICPLAGKSVVELGAGTGRVTRLLAPQVARIAAFDGAPTMLTLAAQTISGENWSLAAANNIAMPVKSAAADVVIAGWSIGHTQAWYPDEWRERVSQVLGEMFRIVNHSGTVVIIETMGTNTETPKPPHAGLTAYYEFLEGEHGFNSTHTRTDFKFPSVGEAQRLLRFFFGDEFTNPIASEIVPACTGFWWRQA